MSSRISYGFAVTLLLAAAALRLWHIDTLPLGLHDGEIIDIRIVETAREGSIEVFYDLGTEGREGLYHVTLALVTALIGSGSLGYRLLSVWANLVALALVYAVGQRLFGRMAALGALGLLSVSFWPILLSRLVGRASMLPLLVAGVLLVLSMAFPVYRRRRRRGDNTTASAALGAVLALGLYIHPVGLLTVVLGMIFIVYMILARNQMSRRRVGYISFTLLLMIILSMPYIISSFRSPHLGGAERLTGDYPTLSAQSVVNALEGIAISGDTNPLYNVTGRPMFDPLSGLLIAVGFLVTVLRWRQPRYALMLVAAVVLSPVFLLAPSAPTFLNYAATLPVLGILFGLGLKTLAQWSRRHGTWLVGIGLAVLIVFNMLWTIRDLSNRWPELPAVQDAYHSRLGALAHYIDRTADDIPTVVCGWRVDQSPASPTLSDAQLIELMMVRGSSGLRYVDCNNAFVMTNGGERQQVILPTSAVLQQAHPRVREWLAEGEFVNNGIAPADGVLVMNVEQALADRMGRLTQETQVQYGPEVAGAQEERVGTPVTFGGNLTFLGYVEEPDPRYRPGSIVTVVTYWRADGPVPPDVRLFIHVLADPGARPPANTDTINLDPGLLRNRDVFLQVTYVPLPQSLPSGDYVVSVGAYRDISDVRLNVLEDGVSHGTRLLLHTISVAAE